MDTSVYAKSNYDLLLIDKALLIFLLLARYVPNPNVAKRSMRSV